MTTPIPNNQPATPAPQQQSQQFNLLQLLRQIFVPGSVKNINIGSEVNHVVSNGTMSTITATVQTPTITIEGDTNVASELARIQADSAKALQDARNQLSQATNGQRRT